MSGLRLIRYGSWAAIALIGAVVGWTVLQPGRQGSGFVGGPFRLASTEGGAVDWADLKGKPWAVFFGFTQCPDVCPTTMLEMAETMQSLGAPAKDFRVYFVTVDPERDDAATLKQYVGSFDPRIVGLVPKDEAELAEVAKEYRIYYKKVPSQNGYTMDHSAGVLLFDKAGQFAGIIDPQDPPDARKAKLRRLLTG